MVLLVKIYYIMVLDPLTIGILLIVFLLYISAWFNVIVLGAEHVGTLLLNGMLVKFGVDVIFANSGGELCWDMYQND